MPFYTEHKRPKDYIDLSRHRFVPVLASYNTEGQCVPVYFRYVFTDGTYADIAIDRITNVSKTVCRSVYNCDITVDDLRKKSCLRFIRTLVNGQYCWIECYFSVLTIKGR